MLKKLLYAILAIDDTEFPERTYKVLMEDIKNFKKSLTMQNKKFLTNKDFSTYLKKKYGIFECFVFDEKNSIFETKKLSKSEKIDFFTAFELLSKEEKGFRSAYIHNKFWTVFAKIDNHLIVLKTPTYFTYYEVEAIYKDVIEYLKITRGS